MRRYFVLLALFVVMLSVLPAHGGSHGWLLYYEGGFSGKVIDAETKEPIEGAVVLAVYHVRLYAIFSGTEYADAQETLTDREGMFHIPPNVFLHAWPTAFGGEDTSFIIFKPGYGSFPDHRISPPMEIDLSGIEDFFSGKTGEAGYLMNFMTHKKMKVTFGVVELPRLKTREERNRVLSGLPPSVPDDKMLMLIELMNKEEIDLGYQPSHQRMDKKGAVK